MKFRYLKTPLPAHAQLFGPSILRPIIPINLRRGDAAFQYEALIDSGADFCILSAEIGEYLGLEILSGKLAKFGGAQAADDATAYLHNITIEIGGYAYRALVGFSFDIAPYGYGVLGQHGFFDHFLVTFDFQKERVELKPRS